MTPGALRGLAFVLLVLGLALVLSASAREAAPVAGEPGSRPPVPASTDERRLRDELRLLRAEIAASASEPRDPEDQSRVEAFRRVAARLESLIRQRLEALALPQSDTQVPPVPLILRGGPPHPVRELDLLRDQLDSLVAQRAALRLLSARVSGELETALEAQRRAAESLRLYREAAERARGGPKESAERDRLRLARLEARAAELELARSDLARENVAQRLAALTDPIEALERTVEGARSHQVIGPEDLAATGAQVEAERSRIEGQRREVLALLERLESNARRTGREPEPATKVLRETLAVLAELDAVEAGRVDVWAQRRAALEASDEQGGDARLASLGQSRLQVRAHERLVAERLRLLRSEERLQVSRLSAAPGSKPDRGVSLRTVDALKRRIEVEERLLSTLQAYDVLFERTLSDLSVFERARSRADRLADLGRRLAGGALRVWRFELFNAVETTVVEGRKVDVAYGVTVGKVIGVLSLSLLGWWIAGVVATRVLRAMVASGRATEQSARVLRRWLMILLLVLIVLVVLALARVPLTAFAFLGGAIAIGVGFAAQNLIKNLISGVIILVERKIRVGDVVALDGILGTVTAVDLRATTVRDFDGIHVLMPNSRLLEASVADWTYLDRKVRSAVEVFLAVDADAVLASGIMLACARAHPDVLADPPPETIFHAIGHEGFGLRLQYWVLVGGPRGGPSIASDLRHAIVRRLRESGVPLARLRHEVLLEPGGLSSPAR